MKIRQAGNEEYALLFSLGSKEVEMINKTFKINTWLHIVWIQNKTEIAGWSGKKNWRVDWDIYLNRTKINDEKDLSFVVESSDIPKMSLNVTHFVLGDSDPPDPANSFSGSFAHVHMWDEQAWKNLMPEEDHVISLMSGGYSGFMSVKLYEDFLLTYCGSNVQWAKFRSGLRGDVALIWPSGIWEMSITKEGKRKALQEDCNTMCSLKLGAKCPEEANENIFWPRTPAGSYALVPCPPKARNTTFEISINKIVTNSTAYRKCIKNEHGTAAWDTANVDSCISRSVANLDKVNFVTLADNLEHCEQFRNLTLSHIESCYQIVNSSKSCDNTIDLAKTIKYLKNLVRFVSVKKPSIGLTSCARGEDNEYFLEKYLLNVSVIADFLMDNKCEIAWNRSVPAGNLGHELLQVMDTVLQQFAEHFSNLKEYFTLKNAGKNMSKSRNLVIKVGKVLRMQSYHKKPFNTNEFPSSEELKMYLQASGKEDCPNLEQMNIKLAPKAFEDVNEKSSEFPI
ncbi:hypothetical protein Ciccas_010630 [Cichlidogyrus casuarinus]|uniref:G-protein coupled receptors family 2 profile 1 domain-containing protein n=1 Tax=Cichlidogyrus casuarinus TaxID=1844966 RepID=A0ABD2PVM3_9PLAT